MAFKGAKGRYYCMNSYMAIWYSCNQRCLGCPCTQIPDRKKSMTLKNVHDHIAELLKSRQVNEPVYVTISGGEPTLHPDFMEIVGLMRNHGIILTVLSNGEKFGSQEFCDTFLKQCDVSRTRIITTIHSSIPGIHEQQNGSAGSFQKSMQGLKYLSQRRTGVTVKHCVNAVNAADTLNFVKMVDEQFLPDVDIELWGFDYSGLTKAQAGKLFMPFREMQPYVEAALDYCLAASARNGRRTLVYNIPLCSVDPIYWHMFVLKENAAGYDRYFDPGIELANQKDSSGIFSRECLHCIVRDYCPGTYRSMFSFFGDETVSAVRGGSGQSS